MPYEIMWFEQQPGIICSIKLEQADANTFQFSLQRLDARAANVISTCQSNEETLPSTGKSYDQALSEAEQIVDDLNIDYMDLAFSGKGKEGFVDPYAFPNIQQDEFYVFAFTRCYNGYHEQLHCSANFGGSSYTVEEESQTWSNEYLVITIDKEGLRNVEWRSPSMLVTVENENAELAAFDDVANTLKEEGVSYLHRQQSWAGEPYMDEYNIDTIQLGLTKITDPREEGKYLLIPAWQLRGSYVIHVPQENWEGFVASYIGIMNGEAMVHSIYTPEINGDIVQDLPLTNYMTINALDANIIERKWE